MVFCIGNLNRLIIMNPYKCKFKRINILISITSIKVPQPVREGLESVAQKVSDDQNGKQVKPQTFNENKFYDETFRISGAGYIFSSLEIGKLH